MCGIVGVVGKPARDIILNGLTNLEYRGYDSAGIYLNDLNGNEYLTKAVGRISNLKETEARGAFGIVITTKDLDDFEDYTKIVVPTTSMFTQSMLVVPALQLLSYYVALKRGCDIDKPRNLAKSVTVE